MGQKLPDSGTEKKKRETRRTDGDHISSDTKHCYILKLDCRLSIFIFIQQPETLGWGCGLDGKLSKPVFKVGFCFLKLSQSFQGNVSTYLVLDWREILLRKMVNEILKFSFYYELWFPYKNVIFCVLLFCEIASFSSPFRRESGIF